MKSACVQKNRSGWRVLSALLPSSGTGDYRLMRWLYYGLVISVAASAQSAVLKVDPNPIRETDRHRFLGTNAGLWHEARQLFDADVQYYLRELNPSFIRIPGGSWSARRATSTTGRPSW